MAITGTIEAVDTNHDTFVQLNTKALGGSINAVDYHDAQVIGAIANSGSVNAIDSPHILWITGSDLRTGHITAIDKSHNGILTGKIIAETTTNPKEKTFIQNRLLSSNDLSLTLMDSTYIDGSWSGDGTHTDSTYWEPRPYNPVWINYSVWDGSTLVGTRERYATNPQVGQFYANMYTPDIPGNYQIQWRYQKDNDSLGRQINQNFNVRSSGIDADRT